jgi:membrane-associated phospholipid phosphatase
MNHDHAIGVPAVRVALVLLAAAVVLSVATLLDGWAYANLVDPRIYERDWGRLLRVIGYLPLWILMAAALVLHDRGEQPRGIPVWRRGALLFGAALTGGVAAEVLKLLLRRERPRLTDGEYFFRAFGDRPFHSGGIGLPSSHTLVAFAAAAMLARLFPRAAPVWYLLASGCALTRVMTRAHFLSDVTLAALVGWAIVALIWRWQEKRTPARPDEEVRAG